MTLPLHILARMGQPGEQVTARIRWQDGTELTRILPVLQGDDGRGLVIGNLAWMTESQPPQPTDRDATLDLRNSFGNILAQRPIQVLRWDDTDTQPIELAWVLGDQIAMETRRVPKTLRIGTAALEELLWGPRPGRESDSQNHDLHLRSTREVIGYRLQARDGTSGQVVDFILDHTTWTLRSVVVDTGTWWPGRRVVLPWQCIEGIHWVDSMVEVGVLRATVKRHPTYDPTNVRPQNLAQNGQRRP